MSWLTYTHPEYDRKSPKIGYALDHYRGDVLDKLDTYLIRHKQGESQAAYVERKKIADYTPHYGFAVDSLAGQLFAVEGEVLRTWQAEEAEIGLGDPATDDTIMSRLWYNIDGKGTNYPTLWRTLAPKVITAFEYWEVVEGLTERTNPETQEKEVVGDARVILISPEDVLDWEEKDGRLEWVKVRHMEIERSGPREKAESKPRYTLYELGGWTRYRTETQGDTTSEVIEAQGSYVFYESRHKRRRMLPIRRFELPIDRMIGYMMARKANAIFNLESSRDFLLWAANFIRMRIENSDDTDEQINKRLSEGWSWFRAGAIEFVNPSSEPATVASTELRRKVEDFYVTFFRSYSDAAREKTATEIRQDTRSGVEAFLLMLKTAIDEAENFALFCLEQIYFPDQPEAWGRASVERPDKFQPVDPEKIAEKLTERYFAKRVPAGRTALLNLAKKLLTMDGVDFDEAELEREVDEFLANPPPVPGVDEGRAPGSGVTARDADRLRLLREQVERLQTREAA